MGNLILRLRKVGARLGQGLEQGPGKVGARLRQGLDKKQGSGEVPTLPEPCPDLACPDLARTLLFVQT